MIHRRTALQTVHFTNTHTLPVTWEEECVTHFLRSRTSLQIRGSQITIRMKNPPCLTTKPCLWGMPEKALESLCMDLFTRTDFSKIILPNFFTNENPDFSQTHRPESGSSPQAVITVFYHSWVMSVCLCEWSFNPRQDASVDLHFNPKFNMLRSHRICQFFFSSYIFIYFGTGQCGRLKISCLRVDFHNKGNDTKEARECQSRNSLLGYWICLWTWAHMQYTHYFKYFVLISVLGAPSLGAKTHVSQQREVRRNWLSSRPLSLHVSCWGILLWLLLISGSLSSTDATWFYSHSQVKTDKQYNLGQNFDPQHSFFLSSPLWWLMASLHACFRVAGCDLWPQYPCITSEVLYHMKNDLLKPYSPVK